MTDAFYTHVADWLNRGTKS